MDRPHCFEILSFPGRAGVKNKNAISHLRCLVRFRKMERSESAKKRASGLFVDADLLDDAAALLVRDRARVRIGTAPKLAVFHVRLQLVKVAGEFFRRRAFTFQ